MRIATDPFPRRFSSLVFRIDFGGRLGESAQFVRWVGPFELAWSIAITGVAWRTLHVDILDADDELCADARADVVEAARNVPVDGGEQGDGDHQHGHIVHLFRRCQLIGLGGKSWMREYGWRLTFSFVTGRMVGWT